jgi:glycosyltransferase involved in cell wall biosynthesis
LLSLMLDQGGSERQLTEMALALDRTRYEPHVGMFRSEGMRAQELGAAAVPVVHFPVHSFRSAAAVAGAIRLARYVRRHRIALVHSFDAPLSVFAAPVARYLTRAAMLSSQRGHRSLTPEYRRLLRLTDRLVDGIVVNCQYVKRHLMEDEKVPERLIHVCFNGIDLDRFRDAPAPRPAALEGARRVIGTVCALRPEKGLSTLLEAFAQLAPRERGWRLAIVGSGPERPALEARATALGIAGECVFQPATAAVGEWLRAMDVFVMPSYEEAFSNAIMEAMACGRAVVATTAGGNPELVEPERRGLLVPPRDAAALAAALERLLLDDPLRTQLACAGRAFVTENLSRERSAARLADIYDAVLAAGSSRRR